jgi:hypothetical protein
MKAIASLICVATVALANLAMGAESARRSLPHSPSPSATARLSSSLQPVPIAIGI